MESTTSQSKAILPVLLKNLMTAAMFALVVFALYANTLNNPFVFDDVPFIEKNPDIAIQDISLSSLKQAAFSSPRPVTNLSFALNYLYDGYRVGGFHVVNMAVHVLAGLGMYFFLLGLMSTPGWKVRTRAGKWAPYVAALVWLVHPVHTSSVTYIVQRSNSLAAMFCLWALVAYIRARQSKDRERIVFFILSFFLGLMAAGSKENALVLPFLILLMEWFFFQDLDRAWAGRFSMILGGLCGLAVLATVMFLGTHPLDTILFDYKDFDFSPWQRIITEPRVLILYLSLLVFPYPGRLILDYDTAASTGFLSPPQTLAAMAAVFGLLVASLLIAKKHRLASFAILWFFVAIFLESSFIPLDLVFEHRVYLPSVLPLAAVVAYAFSRENWAKPMLAFSCCVIVLFGAWTVERNKVWQTDVGLWQDTVAKAPGNARAQNNLGLALANEQKLGQAMDHFKKAVALKPEFGHANYNLGIMLASKSEHAQAIVHFSRAVESEPGDVTYRNDLALSLMARQDWEGALENLYTALRLEPEYAPTHNNLGVALGGQAMYKEALEHFRKAVEIFPEYTDAHRNLGIILIDLENYPQAARHFGEVLKKQPNDAQAHFFVGRCHVAMGNLKEAARSFMTAADIVPGYAPAQYNAGLTLMGLGDYRRAFNYFRTTLRLDPTNKDASRNMKACVEKIKEAEEQAAGVPNA